MKTSLFKKESFLFLLFLFSISIAKTQTNDGVVGEFWDFKLDEPITKWMDNLELDKNDKGTKYYIYTGTDYKTFLDIPIHKIFVITNKEGKLKMVLVKTEKQKLEGPFDPIYLKYYEDKFLAKYGKQTKQGFQRATEDDMEMIELIWKKAPYALKMEAYYDPTIKLNHYGIFKLVDESFLKTVKLPY